MYLPVCCYRQFLFIYTFYWNVYICAFFLQLKWVLLCLFFSFLLNFIVMQRSLTRSSIVRNEWCLVFSFFGADNLIISFNCVWIAQLPRSESEISKCRVTRVRSMFGSAHKARFYSADHSREQRKMTAKPLYNFIINYIILASFSGDMPWAIRSGNSSYKKKKTHIFCHKAPCNSNNSEQTSSSGWRQ